MRHKFSIITTTFNRAHLLPRVFASLQAQTLRDFEWLVIDDGSTDATREVIRSFVHNASWPVRYTWQRNSGKHVATNVGVQQARGFLIGILDSDDQYLPHALERCWVHWRSIPREQRDGFVGVTALTASPDGAVVGTKYPREVFDSDSLETNVKYLIRGDKKGFQRADVLRRFQFPEDLGEFVPEALVWNRIALHYRTRYVNEVWSVIEYQHGGLSARMTENRVKSANASMTYYKELLQSGRTLPFVIGLRNCANLVRFSIHAGRLRRCTGISKSQLALSLPVGVALYIRDRIKLAQA